MVRVFNLKNGKDVMGELRRAKGCRKGKSPKLFSASQLKRN